MKTTPLRVALAGLITFTALALRAEDVTLAQSAVLKADRTMISLKAGTVVELINRDGDMLTVKYKNLTGKIPANKLEEPAAAPAKPEGERPNENKPESPAARPPQTGYGKAVQKAKDNAKEHDKNLVKPADEILN